MGSDRPAPALPRALRGFFLSAAAMDGGFFLIMTAMPFKVLDLGGGALELGLVPAIAAVIYVVAAPISSRANVVLRNLVQEFGSRDGRWLRCMSPGTEVLKSSSSC